MEMTIHCFSFPGIMELGKRFLRRKIVDSRGLRIWMSRRSPVHSTWTQTMTNPKWMLHRCSFHNDVLHSHNPRVTMPVFAISVNGGKPIRRLGKISVGAVAEHAAFVIKETETNVGQTVVLCWQIGEKLVQFIGGVNWLVSADG